MGFLPVILMGDNSCISSTLIKILGGLQRTLWPGTLIPYPSYSNCNTRDKFTLLPLALVYTSTRINISVYLVVVI